MYTSLVFLVVLGIWAAYLVQQWMRRREHLLTARSVDAFTEALRVLERRPAATITTPARPRSYAVSPLRTQPDVVVKHSGPGDSGADGPRTGATARTAGTKPRGTRARAASLVGASVSLLVAVVACALGAVGWYVPVAAAVLLGIDVAYLRWSTTHARALQRADAHPPSRVVDAATVTAEPVVEPVTEHLVDDAPAAPVEPTQAEPDLLPEATAPEGLIAAPPSRAARRMPDLFDIRAFDEPEPEPVHEPVDEEPVDEEPPAAGTWRPTPVPAPLYTRKQTFPEAPPRPVPVPAAPVESDSVLSPVDIDDEVLEMESPFRQVVNG